MPFLTKYQQKYGVITISGAAIFPLPVARSRYLRYCCSLIYPLITETEENESAEVGSAEGDASLFTDIVVVFI